MNLPDDKLAEFRERMAATPDAPWDGVEQWLNRALELARPGGVISLVMPDGRSFAVRKPAAEQ